MSEETEKELRAALVLAGNMADAARMVVGGRLITTGQRVSAATVRTGPDKLNNWHQSWNADVYGVAQAVGILKERILFSGMTDKGAKVRDHGIRLHLDDSLGHVSDVRRYADAMWFKPGRAAECLQQFTTKAERP